MRRFLWAAAVALPLLAVAEQRASAWGCCGPGCGLGLFGKPHYFPCLGVVPGPWYTYWPTGPGGEMISEAYFGHWKYRFHFQTPVPIGDSFCSDYGGGGFYPSYWYGR
jgi:hypothetical protein